MSQAEDEIRRIHREYARRAQEKDENSFYSLFHPGILYQHTQRARQILSMLRRHGINSLHGRTILEIGCGGGGVLREFLAYGADVSRLYGIELLEWHLHQAYLVNSNFRLACADGQALPYPDGSFDLALQFTVFTSVLSIELKAAMAREMLRVLRPDGLILWYDFWLNPTNPQTKGVRPREVKALFPNCHFEFRRVTLAPPIARRLAKWAWGVCLLLEWLRLFNSHYLVAIQPRSGKVCLD
jgi:ubiquinone/menaquinone biosynthesis C-methylase UbiE